MDHVQGLGFIFESLMDLCPLGQFCILERSRQQDEEWIEGAMSHERASWEIVVITQASICSDPDQGSGTGLERDRWTARRCRRHRKHKGSQNTCNAKE